MTGRRRPRSGAILDVRVAARELAPLDEAVALHVAQAGDERAAADRVQRLDELRGAARAARQIAHDQQRPLVADQLQRARHRATVAFASSHLMAVAARREGSAAR